MSGKKPEERCPECGIRPPGHKLDCKTGNERAKKYQDELQRKYLRRRNR